MNKQPVSADSRERFGSRLGFVLVSAGCAIGLGNVWKFPYICGQYGGAAFILIYLLFLIILGLPILTCEYAVGRRSQLGIARAFDALQPAGSRFHLMKWPSLLGNTLLMMFYLMVSGWMLYYAWHYAVGDISALGSEQVAPFFGNLLSQPGTLTIWMLIALTVSCLVCIIGLKNGVERISKVMMLLLLGLMIVLAAHSLLLDNAVEGIRFYLVPDFQKTMENGVGNAIFAAMSQAFFTLSLGIGSMEIFGSYLDRKNTLLKESATVVALDTFVALTAGFIVIPACLSYGVNPGAGPGLLFITLPNVFNQMAGGRILGFAFFVFMSFAALSTAIAVIENILVFFMDKYGWSRKKATVCVFLGLLVLSMPAILGFNVLNHIQPFNGTDSGLMDLEDFLVSQNLLPLGSLLYVLFCTRKNGLGWDQYAQEVNTGAGIRLPQWMRFYMSYILPLIILGIYVYGYYSFLWDPQKNLAIGEKIAWIGFAALLLLSVFIIGFTAGKKKAEKN